jgi:mRNA interferase RelE/StbE
MDKYTILLSKKAQKQLDKLVDYIAEPIINAIAQLETNPRPEGCKKLKGRKGYRIRTGNYRIIYDIFETELLIDIITIGHRKDVYEK